LLAISLFNKSKIFTGIICSLLAILFTILIFPEHGGATNIIFGGFLAAFVFSLNLSNLLNSSTTSFWLSNWSTGNSQKNPWNTSSTALILSSLSSTEFLANSLICSSDFELGSGSVFLGDSLFSSDFSPPSVTWLLGYFPLNLLNTPSSAFSLEVVKIITLSGRRPIDCKNIAWVLFFGKPSTIYDTFSSSYLINCSLTNSITISSSTNVLVL
jgi:hypothetical protein